MTLKIPDELLAAAKLDERGVLIELACRLFESDRLTLGQAARLAGIARTDFEDELHDRKVPIYRYGQEEWGQDQEAIAKMKR
jgi:predicted HTH domain antitoxin